MDGDQEQVMSDFVFICLGLFYIIIKEKCLRCFCVVVAYAGEVFGGEL